MTFAARITRCPIPYEPERTADTRERFTAFAPELRALLEGTAGCSPYLADLMMREADWLDEALSGSPEAALDATLTGFGELDSAALKPALRRAKARVALLAGLADLGGVWPLEGVTGALTRLADLSVHESLRALVADEIRRGKVPGAVPEDAGTAAGIVALAMGKMGAGELNYSSDIDLICLFDETRYDADDVQDARAAFIKVVRRMAALLSDLTPDGYVFRTDLRLRPDAAVTPVCISMAAAEQYYEAQGRTWERAAYIKARSCGGDIAAGDRFLATLTPFVWRRHLDFAAIQDAHDMRLRIREHKGLHGPIVLEGHDMKLGVGGIREIEFFTQTRQLIAGGRDPELRQRDTVGGLAALASKGWVPAADAKELTDHYRAHREVEHRVQMVADAQTHDLPANGEGFDRLARMMGEPDTQALRAALQERLERVAELTEGFFAPGEAGKGPEISDEMREVVEGWRAYPSLRSGRAVAIFKRLQPEILSRLKRAANPSEALRQFDGFLSGLPAGVQLFSLFDANPQLVDLIVDICATAPGLAAYLSRNAAVLDAVIGGDFFAPWPGAPALSTALAERLAEQSDYEWRLTAARIWAREWHFRIGVHHLRGLIDANQAGREYADLAGAILSALWPVCVEEFARKHGTPPGRGAVVVGMGSLGAERLNAASDLDLIVIYDADGTESSDGSRPLAARAYYARLTQALVTALSAPMADGRLYEVDMRLRPSGRQGPVATSIQSFRSYQMEEAWTWEHLALTRARPVAGETAIGVEVEAARKAVLAAKGGAAKILTDVAEMRERIFAAKASDGAWEAKIGPGRLQDIELLAQSCALRAAVPARRVEAQLRAGKQAGFLSKEDEAALQEAYRFLWRLQAGGRLLTERPLDMEAVGEGARAFLMRETGASELAGMASLLDSHADRAGAIIARSLALPDDAADERAG
ncbi:Bifunctional glutamine synthetase adenylyltransferase/adenylyl-removing enzyme [Defluviimonas aquaemixtae]|uniref:Bifunctional glutamine synthetase adenylyltransferase/adenylyl-removing enzyme n=1 Tax=Albidovulum aquaemixtae TaxID=1542388 RepID=A0A2R8B603_9RHOB|nr:bifunctional [glutamine synthetase] adenylyltransferase/[glutamine synthetase]-adenylyl-L-tyrosine phosphorylase [Defluviimonas aquaemixtae]SPH18071.1 Bifunctional glutamine synthetase adenylyltransferase/adenylyl-removing enzyme [Defluviimonas aquaemixtae]